MKYCPITYEQITDNEHYSRKGLKLLSNNLQDLLPLQYSAEEQRAEALARLGKMSIQGIQPKLSAKLKIKEGKFELVDHFGDYLLKLQSLDYPELPENEAITMTLAQVIGLQVPVHGLVYAKDNTMTYFIKRFDKNKKFKYAVEDFAQLNNCERDTKYMSSMEKVVKTIHQHTSFPRIEFIKFFKLTLFNYIVGNEDMHLKNFSLITINNKTSLSPHYDLVNTTIVQKNVKEELALPLNGKKNNLTYNDFMNYLGKDILGLNEQSILAVLQQIKQALPVWNDYIDRSFLSPRLKEDYKVLLAERSSRLRF